MMPPSLCDIGFGWWLPALRKAAQSIKQRFDSTLGHNRALDECSSMCGTSETRSTCSHQWWLDVWTFRPQASEHTVLGCRWSTLNTYSTKYVTYSNLPPRASLLYHVHPLIKWWIYEVSREPFIPSSTSSISSRRLQYVCRERYQFRWCEDRWPS